MCVYGSVSLYFFSRIKNSFAFLIGSEFFTSYDYSTQVEDLFVYFLLGGATRRDL